VARRPDPDVEARELNSDIEELLPLLRTTAGATIAVAWQRWEGPVAVSLEADGFANALLNLVVNARDALEGVVDPRIDVALRRARFAVDEDPLLAAGDYAEVEVRDNGCGMTPEVRARVMEPFFSTKPRGRGTGLGLPMACAYARNFGGTLRIDSGQGGGTSVRMLLPLVKAAAAMPASGFAPTAGCEEG
jgi:signal transduction histidine kinase